MKMTWPLLGCLCLTFGIGMPPTVWGISGTAATGCPASTTWETRDTETRDTETRGGQARDNVTRETEARDTVPRVEVVQGEYLGWMVVDGVRRPFGLQVVARGQGRFTAGLLPGGLPEPGNRDPHPTPLTGEIADAELTLRSEGGLVFRLGREPVYHFFQVDRQGQTLGRFERVQRISATLGMAPPPNAVVLFRDGQAHELENVKLTAEGNLGIGAVTRFPVGDFRLHVEFRLPLQADKNNQDRGNSGIYMQRRYEIQILDSFGEPVGFNRAASLYRQRSPMSNLSLPPLAWQTYDIWFTAARWSADGQKTRNARVTVAHNGVVVHRDVEIMAKTGAGRTEGPEPLPILFQDHSDPVEFRNIWLVQPADTQELR